MHGGGSAPLFPSSSRAGVNGKIVIDATERALHHYGSGINAVVTLGAFVRLPNDTALLELGHGATMGTLTTVNASSGVIASEEPRRPIPLLRGAPRFRSPPRAVAWHGDASLLIPDPYAADAGVNICALRVTSGWLNTFPPPRAFRADGSSRGWGCYVVDDADWGLLGYGCDVTPSASSAAASDIAPRRIHADASAGPVDVVPTDPLRRSLYIAPIGLLLRADTLPILNATVDLRRSGGAPSLTLRFDTSGGAAACPGLYAAARLEVSLPVVADLATVADVAWVSPQPAPPPVRGAYELPCDAGSAVLTWTWLPGPASHD